MVLVGFYRHFIRGYTTIAASLTKLTTQDPFEWSATSQTAFDALKIALTSAPILLLPDFTIPFTLEMDASRIGMGAVLSQNSHLIAFFSKFSPKLLCASTYVMELFAIIVAVKKWCHYLLGHQFTIITDHRSLKELLTQVVQTPEQQMYMAHLIGYDYSIQYRTGKSSVVTDALSRTSNPVVSSLLFLSVPLLTFLETLKQQLRQDQAFVQLQQAILVDRRHIPITLSFKTWSWRMVTFGYLLGSPSSQPYF